MKLRNKKTGEVEEFKEIYLTKTVKETNTAISEYVDRSYYGIDELNEEWENYKPKEPLIKDEKIRKAVRAWAEASEIETAEYDDCWVSFRSDDKVIGFKDVDNCLCLYGLVDNTTYTIAELCGEEKE